MRRWGYLALVGALFACTGSKPVPPAQPKAPEAAPIPDAGPMLQPPLAPVDSGVPDAGLADVGVADAGVRVPPPTVPQENSRPGDSAWNLTGSAQGLGAYCDATSYRPGDTVEVHAAAPAAIGASYSVYRLGYYGGALGRKLLSGSAQLPASTAAVLDRTTGAVRAGWPAAFDFTLPPDAASGVYLVKLSAGSSQAYATFVVREPSPRAPILVAIAVNTYQAYNSWGGTSLYDNSRSDWPSWHAYAVSFDRPYARGDGAGNLFLNGDREFITFAEGQGYDVAYVTDTDLDREPGLLLGRTLIVVPGHTEYWTAAMRDGFEAAIARGENVAFFGANDAYWQVRYDLALSPGRRLLVGYKEFWRQDPALQTDPAHVTGRWRDSPIDRPEAQLMGVMFGDWLTTSSPLYVKDAASWVWSGTGVAEGEEIPGVFGDETDHEFGGAPDEDDHEVAEGLVESRSGALDLAQSVIYQKPGQGRVFSAATLEWCRSLARAGVWDVRIQQATANVIAGLAGGAVPAPLVPLNLPPGAPSPSSEAGAQVSTIASGLSAPAAIAMRSATEAVVLDGNEVLSVTATAVQPLAGAAEAGNLDGPALQARFSRPRGVAVAADGTIYVADTGNHRIRAISPAGQVTTLAGSTEGFTDALGPLARFDTPEGLALLPDGSIAVADMWNHRVRKVAPDGTVTTLAGNGQPAAIDGAAAQASFNYPFAIASRADGTLFVVETESGRVRTISPAGAVSTVAGAPGAAGWADGTLASARVSETVGVSASATRLFLFDGASARVREVTASQVLTVAGGGRGGDGPGPSARFGYLRGGAIASDGSLWVVDSRLGQVRRISLP
jgi:hypothetical protein